MLVVLKYTLAGQPCKSCRPAPSTGAARGTGVVRAGETEGEGIDWEKQKWAERRRRGRSCWIKDYKSLTLPSCNTKCSSAVWATLQSGESWCKKLLQSTVNTIQVRSLQK